MLFSNKRSSFSKLRLKQNTVFCLPGFHVDPVWRRTQAEYIEHSLFLIRQFLIACRADPYYGVYLSEIDALKPYLDLYPEDRHWVANLVQQERMATGGSYNQPNETSISGESLIRNLLIGRLYHKITVGDKTQVYMGWDAFGHVPQLPQILEQCGMRAAVFTRTDYRDPSIAVPGFPDLFQWLAPNGSWIYARRVDYFLPSECSLEQEADRRFEKQKTQNAEVAADLLLDTGDMHSPRTAILGRCRELTHNPLPIITTGAAATKYFSYVETAHHDQKIQLEPVTRDLTQYNEGCELSRIDLKIANHRVETMLLEAELWATIASAYGFPYPYRRLDYAWRQLLFCQHHDGICGCGTDLVLVDLLESYREALEAAEETRRASLEALGSLISTRSHSADRSILVFNSLPWRRDTPVAFPMILTEEMDSFVLEKPNGEEIPYEIEPRLQNDEGSQFQITVFWKEKDLPATGYQPVLFKKGEPAVSPYISRGNPRSWIENEFLRVEVDPMRGGGIVSLIHKESGREFINTHHAQPANDVTLLIEGAGEEPAWRLLTTGEKKFASSSPALVEVWEGPVSTRLIIRGKGPGFCKRVQEIRLTPGQPYIDCFTILEDYCGYGRPVFEEDPQQIRDLFVTVFPLNLPGALPVLEDRFYAKAYRRSRGYLDFFSTLRAWKSQHAMNSCCRWVDVSWTFLILFPSENQETRALAVGPAEAVIALDTHRSLREKLMLYLAKHGVTCTPRYDRDDPSADRLFRQCSFCIGTKEENRYTQRLLERNPEASAYYERRLNEDGYTYLAVEDVSPESGYPAIPVFIFAGKNETQTAQAVDAMIQSTVAHRWACPAEACFLLNPGPVEDAGLALLNRGNKLCSLESDGTLALALMHTTPFPSPETTWPFDFPEQKTHIFQYRLIPHEGDWRQAEIPRKAMEYNHEPTAVWVPSHPGPLPESLSFWSVEPGNILISALKPSGLPVSEYQIPATADHSTILRLYEAHGEDSNLWLESHNDIKSVKSVQIDESPLPSKREIYHEDRFIRTVTHAHEIVTLQLHLKPKALMVKPVWENPVRAPIYAPARYWRLNHGAAPEGFQPVSISLRGKIKPETVIQTLELVVVNNYPQTDLSGEVTILTPPYWRTIPSKITYRLARGAFQVVPIYLILEGSEREGFVKAQTQVNDIQVEDCLQLGVGPDFDVGMTLTRASFNIHLRHSHAYAVAGSAALITPVEAWSESLMSRLSLAAISPWKQNFLLQPEQENTLVFPIQEYQNLWKIRSDHFWILVKIAAHHTLRYYHVRLDERISEGLGKILCPPYELDAKK